MGKENVGNNWTSSCGCGCHGRHSMCRDSVAEEDNGMVRSYLTGKLVPESIGRTKAISVMLNNIQAASHSPVSRMRGCL